MVTTGTAMTETVQHLRDVAEILCSDRADELNPKIVAAICRMAANEIERLEGGHIPAGKADPSTSRRAYEHVKMRANSQRHRLLEQYLLHGDLIDEEAGELAGLRRPGCTFWARLSELRSAGLLETTGHTRISSAGEQQNVCRITDLGRLMYDSAKVA